MMVFPPGDHYYFLWSSQINLCVEIFNLSIFFDVDIIFSIWFFFAETSREIVSSSSVCIITYEVGNY